jgi:pimeloyl-ACP methyl ester carboxylesterase
MSFKILQHKLPDGRTLSYVDTDPQQQKTAGALVFFHGFPGSCTQGIELMEKSGGQKLRLISVDRPGLGGSSPHPRPTLLTLARDLEHLLNKLNVKKVYLLGISGGAPYATAATYFFQNLNSSKIKVQKLGLICPLASLAEEKNIEAMGRSKALLKLYKKTPWLAKPVLNLWRTLVTNNPEKRMRYLISTYPPRDQQVLNNIEAIDELISYFVSAMKQGVSGLIADLDNYTKPWPFPVESIEARTHIWHGTSDTVVPLQVGRWYAEKLPAAVWRELPDEGHFSLPILYMRAILEEFCLEEK